MITILQDHPITRSKAIETLSRLRAEWEEAAEGESLLEVGLILADVAAGLGLTEEEQAATLGEALYTQIVSM